MAEKQERVKKLFPVQETNDVGIYMVQLYMMGMNINVILDDYFPCHEGSTDIIFSNANGNELWVLLLEKAFAKLNLNYENIIGGDPTESL